MELDPCGVYSVSSTYGSLGTFLLAFTVYFIVCLGWTLVKFTACVAFFEAFGLVVFVALGVFVAFMGHWSWTFVAFFLQCLWGVGVWTFVAFYNFCGIYVGWCCTFSTCVVFSLCMFLPTLHRWVPLGLVYWGSGFSQP